MDSLTSFELIELVLTMGAYVDSQFEYWLSISFAAIVAGAVAGERLNMKVRGFLVFLYLLATALLLLQIFQSGQNIVQLGEILSSRGLMPENNVNTGPYQFRIRMALFFFGTIGTCWFLLAGRRLLDKEPS